MFGGLSKLINHSKCLRCAEPNSPIRETVSDLGGVHKLRFCDKCWNNRLKYKALKEDERIRRNEIENEKIKEDLRIEDMCRKIEVYELEQKMKEYGIR